MIWRENYRLGIETLDNQHIELFQQAENLIQAISSNAPITIYEKTIQFLKDYMISHFEIEEAYQAAIGFPELEYHKKEHEYFKKTILEYEQKLIKNHYDIPTLKNLAGVLTSWLIYHVTDSDQQIVETNIVIPESDIDIKLFSNSAIDVMNTMAGFEGKAVQQKMVKDHIMQGDIFIELPFIGGLQGEAIFGFSKDLALNLVSAMTMMELQEVDELVISALCELTNISCGTASSKFADQGVLCDIKPPIIKNKQDYQNKKVSGMCIETGIGGLEVVALLENV